MFCPQCGKDFEEDICECGFDLNETLTCPYKLSGNCIHTEKECDVYGLDFEDCQLYLDKAGIKL